jgi:hypothetical protein
LSVVAVAVLQFIFAYSVFECRKVEVSDVPRACLKANSTQKRQIYSNMLVKIYFFAIFQKNYDLLEGTSPGLTFELSHVGQEAQIFAADNVVLADKWMTALKEAVTLQE